jgi:hypothetical protein
MADVLGTIGTLLAAASGANPLGISLALKGGCDYVLIRDTIELASSFAQNDRVLLANVPSDFIFDPLGSTIWFDDLGTAITMDVGSTATENALVAAQDVATAAGSCSVVKSVDVANYGKTLWELLSLTADPGGTIAIYAKLEGGDPGTGTMTWQIKGQRKLA